MQHIKDKVKYNRLLKHRYNITLNEVINMKSKQKNKCSICKNNFKNTKGMHIDHCHTFGKVRSLLCSTCNQGLGSFRDDIKLLKLAINYLNKYNKGK